MARQGCALARTLRAPAPASGLYQLGSLPSAARHSLLGPSAASLLASPAVFVPLVHFNGCPQLCLPPRPDHVQRSWYHYLSASRSRRQESKQLQGQISSSGSRTQDEILASDGWRQPEEYNIRSPPVRERPELPAGKKEMPQNVSVLPLAAFQKLKDRQRAQVNGFAEREALQAEAERTTTSSRDEAARSPSAKGFVAAAAAGRGASDGPGPRAAAASADMAPMITPPDSAQSGGENLPLSLCRKGLTVAEAMERNLKRHGAPVPERAERVTTVYTPDNFEDMPELKTEYFLFADYVLWFAYACLWSVAAFSLYVVFTKNPNLKENRWIWNVGEYVSLFGLIASMFMCWAVTAGAR